MICAAFSLSALCIYEIGSDSFYRKISDNITSPPPENENHHADASRVVPVLKRLQYRMIIITLCIFFSLCGIFFIFIQSLIHPLNEMIKVTRRMADGHLNETVTVRSDDEIGKIGENINDLGVNVQEILLHIWKHTADTMEILGQIRKRIPCQEYDLIFQQIESDIEKIDQSMEAMQFLAQGFELYDIHLAQGKVMAGEKKT